MSHIIINNISPVYGANLGSEDNNDADAQAAFDLGYLAFLARGYASLEAELANTTDPTTRELLEQQMNGILAQYNKILALFHVSGGKVTFDFNGHVIEINDPTISSLIQGMEGSSSIQNYLKWYDAEKNSPVEAILNWMNVNHFSFKDHTNDPNTEMAAVMFMLSLENNPYAELAGITDNLLESETGLLDNQQLLAELLTDLCSATGLDPSVLASCLSITTNSSAFQNLSDIFSQNYENWTKNPQPGFASLAALLDYESRFWPQNYGDNTKTTIHSVPLTEQFLKEKSQKTSGGDRESLTPVKIKKINY